MCTLGSAQACNFKRIMLFQWPWALHIGNIFQWTEWILTYFWWMSDDYLTTPWRLPDKCLISVWQHPDDRLMTAWWLLDDSLTTAWRLSDNCLTSVWQHPDNRLMTALWLLDDCLITTWWELTQFSNITKMVENMKTVEMETEDMYRTMRVLRSKVTFLLILVI